VVAIVFFVSSLFRAFVVNVLKGNSYTIKLKGGKENVSDKQRVGGKSKSW